MCRSLWRQKTIKNITQCHVGNRSEDSHLSLMYADTKLFFVLQPAFCYPHIRCASTHLISAYDMGSTFKGMEWVQTVFFLTHCVLLLDAGSLFHFGKESNEIKTNNGNNGPLCVAAKHNAHEYLTSILFDICFAPSYGVTLSDTQCTRPRRPWAYDVCVFKCFIIRCSSEQRNFYGIFCK